MTHTTILVFLATVFAAEFAAFAMQRTLLLLSREKQVPYEFVALLLPVWFPAVWVLRVTKWGLFVYTAFYWSWLVAFGLLAIDVLLSTFLPIPSRAFRAVFLARAHRLRSADDEVARELLKILDGSRVIGS